MNKRPISSSINITKMRSKFQFQLHTCGDKKGANERIEKRNLPKLIGFVI